MLSFFPRDVLGEIWDLIGSVSEGYPTYFSMRLNGCSKRNSLMFCSICFFRNALLSKA